MYKCVRLAWRAYLRDAGGGETLPVHPWPRRSSPPWCCVRASPAGAGGGQGGKQRTNRTSKNVCIRKKGAGEIEGEGGIQAKKRTTTQPNPTTRATQHLLHTAARTKNTHPHTHTHIHIGQPVSTVDAKQENTNTRARSGQQPDRVEKQCRGFLPNRKPLPPAPALQETK